MIHHGRVSGIAAAWARSQDNPQVLPYVDPTTDWVRLPRRFPIEITIDDWRRRSACSMARMRAF